LDIGVERLRCGLEWGPRAEGLARDEPRRHAAVLDHRQRLRGVVREARVVFLLRLRECHPGLDAEEALPSPSPFLVCALGVDDASPGLHPVDRAWLDLPVGAQAVAVPDAAA